MKANIKDNFTNLIKFRVWSNGLKHIITHPTMKSWFNDAQIQSDISNGVFGKEEDLQKLKSGIQEFNRLELIYQLEASIDKSIEANTIPNKKLAYKDLGLGVFSIDRAAQGMY